MYKLYYVYFRSVFYFHISAAGIVIDQLTVKCSQLASIIPMEAFPGFTVWSLPLRSCILEVYKMTQNLHGADEGQFKGWSMVKGWGEFTFLTAETISFSDHFKYIQVVWELD